MKENDNDYFVDNEIVNSSKDTDEIDTITALYIDEALDILAKSDICVTEIVKTIPPRHRDDIEYDKNRRLRVISAERRNPKEVSLIVTPASDTESLFC